MESCSQTDICCLNCHILISFALVVGVVFVVFWITEVSFISPYYVLLLLAVSPLSMLLLSLICQSSMTFQNPGFHRNSLNKLSENLKCVLHMSRIMRKPTISICENKDTDQLRGNREADQRLCFRYTDSTITLLSKSKISSF